MANPEYPAGAFLKSNTTAVVVERRKRKNARQAELDQAYQLVDRRDRRQCQLTGVQLTAGHVDEWRRLERDHLGPRSTNPADRANHDNILTCSAAVHSLLQKGGIIPVDRYGEETVRVSRIVGYRWNDIVMRGARPFRLPKDKVL